MKIYDDCPLWTLIENGTLIGFDLRATALMSLTGIDLHCAPSDMQSLFSHRLARALARCPAETTLRIYSHRMPVQANDIRLLATSNNTPGNQLADASRTHMIANPHLGRTEITLAVSGKKNRPNVPITRHAIIRSHDEISRKAHELHTSMQIDLNERTSSFISALSASGVDCIKLHSADDAGVRLQRLAQPWLTTPPMRRKILPELSLRSQILDYTVRTSSGHFETGNRLVRVLSMHRAPTVVWPGIITALQNLPFSSLLCISLRRIDDAEAKKRVHAARRLGVEWDHVLARIRGANKHSQAPDHEVIRQQQDTNELLSALAGGDVLCDVSVQCVVWGKSHDELAQNTQHAMRAMSECGDATFACEDMRHFEAFIHLLPGCDQTIPDRSHAFLATRAADLCPLFATRKGASKGTAVLYTDTGELYHFHPFNPDLPAWNATVAGSTGSGKSFAVKCLLSGWAGSGGRILIITRGSDYDRFAHVFGGTYQPIKPNNTNLALCPFSPHLKTQEALIRSVLELMVDGGEGIVTRDMRDAIQASLQTITLGDPEQYGWEGWLEALKKYGTMGNTIASRVGYWLKGPWGEALHRMPLDNTSKITAWDIAPVEDDETRTLVLGLLSLSIAHSIASGPTVIVMDEVWSLLASEAGARLIESLYRTVRKEGSGIWSISQSMGDFSSLPRRTRSAILNNATFRFFLRHDSSDAKLVTEEFSLNEAEQEALEHLESRPGELSQLLLQEAGQSIVLNLKPTPLEYWLATSHPADLKVLRSAKETSSWETIQRLAKEFPKGAIHHGS